MPWYEFIWDDGPDGNVDHVAEHGLTPDDVEFVIMHPESVERSRSSDRTVAFGQTPDGRYIIAVYDFVDDITIFPVTAYEPNEE